MINGARPAPSRAAGDGMSYRMRILWDLMLAVRFARTFGPRVERLVLEDPIGLEDYRPRIPPQSTDVSGSRAGVLWGVSWARGRAWLRPLVAERTGADGGRRARYTADRPANAG